MKFKIGQQVFIVEGTRLFADIIKSSDYHLPSKTWYYTMVRGGRCSGSFIECALFSNEEEAKKMLLECIELENIERPKRELAQSTRQKLEDQSAQLSFDEWLLSHGLYMDWLCFDPRN